MSPSVLLIELNEVNFEYIRDYAAVGQLPTFARLIEDHGVAETVSEQKYEHLEPWIQWVTAHTGMSFKEHGIFRLGDAVSFNHPQIWEMLEEQGFLVGAISPMNAVHRLKRPAFFVPDPWTKTNLSGSKVLHLLYSAVAQSVNDNADSRITVSSLFKLALGLAVYGRSWTQYISFIGGAWGRPWRKAMILDLLLSDVFACEVAKRRPNFASLFLNAAAHIQHHYLFCAAPYRGSQRNPSWYIQPSEDPILEVYSLYDNTLANLLRAFPHYLKTRSRLSLLYRRFWLYPRISRYLRGRALDVGCGIGDMVRFRPNTIGVDVNPLLVNFCRAQGLEVQLMQPERLPFSVASFESGVLDNVLEHLNDPRCLLQELRRVLCPGGVLVVGVPGRRGYEADPDHKHFYDEEKLHRTLEASGFTYRHMFYSPLHSRYLDTRLRQYAIYGVFERERDN